MYLAYSNRAFPKNTQVLKDLLEARQQLATTLGYAHYADLATADQMMGSAAHVREMLNQVDDASRAASAKEYGMLLAYAEQQQPGLKNIAVSDAGYWFEQFSRAHFSFDAQSVRPYSLTMRCRREF